MKQVILVLAFLAVSLISLIVTGCKEKEKTPLERTGEQIERTGEDIQDAAEDAQK